MIADVMAVEKAERVSSLWCRTSELGRMRERTLRHATTWLRILSIGA